MDDGRIGHAELRDRRRRALPGRRVSRARPESACAAGGFGQPDAARRRHRRRAGAGARARAPTVQREAYENHGSRSATIIDPFGHRWMLSGPVDRRGRSRSSTATSATCRCGRRTPTAPPRSTATCSAGPTTRRPTRSPTPTQRIGLVLGARSADAVLLLRGGRPRGRTAGDRGRRRHGRRTRSSSTSAPCSDATDPSGAPFAVYQPDAGHTRGRRSTALGQANFRTSRIEVPDSAAFRAFYSRVLFWTFEPGRIDDGWEVQAAHPMAGVAGGNAAAVDRADVDRRRRRRRGGAGARGGRHRHRRTVAAVLRQVGAVHRRPGQPLLPRRVLIAISAR